MADYENIALCIVTHDSPKELNRFAWSIEHSTTYPCKYHILDNGSTSNEAITIAQTLWLNNKGVYDSVNKPMFLGQAYNRLLDSIERKYCAFVPINNILSHGWLQEILHEKDMIENTGAVSIKSQNDNLYISGLLAGDEIRLSYLQKDNNVGGILFAETELLKRVGGFDESNTISGYEFEEISHRIMLEGKCNYYIHRAKRIEFEINNPILFPEKTEQTIYNYRKKLKENFKKTQDGKHESATN
jgi:GT2 family glycosyltransferase